MSTSENNIDSNLRNLVGDETGFNIPEGYFDELRTSIHLGISNQQPAEIYFTLEKPEDHFSVPDLYFENLSSNIHQKIALENEHSDQFNLNIPFELNVPTDYFEQSRKSILEQTINIPKKSRVIKRTLQLNAFYRYASVAALVVLSISLAYWVGSTDTDQNTTIVASSLVPSFENLNDQEILESLRNEDIGDDVYTIASLKDEKTEKQEFNQKIEFKKDSNAAEKQAEIEQFLIENIDDIEEI